MECILNAARLAPSGKNGQPCRYVIINQENLREKIASCSIYGNWMKKAPVLVAVYLDRSHSYDYKKDIQGVGAAIENMCIQAEHLGIGSCWVGEILSKEKEVNAILDVPEDFELMAVVCLGYELYKVQRTSRLELSELIFKVY